ncbi:MAG: type IV pilin protein [Promethearchaeota archaeon]|jgi:prepilin-type N-terminal cleavage/methylation domain-containing protein
MKSKGFTIIELMIVVAIVGILVAIAVPNFLMFQCRAFGNSLELSTELVEGVCRDCTGCEHEGVDSQEALQMIKDGTDPSRFIEWQSEEPVDKPETKMNTRSADDIDFPDERPSGMNTDALPEPVRRSWKD